jgi:hypothetical protein
MQWSFSTATNCYSTSSVTGTGGDIGGLIGYQENSIEMNCYSAGAVLGSSSVGGLIGDQSGGTTTNCFWDTLASGQTSSAGGTGKSTSDMKNYLTYTGWSFKGISSDTVWNMGHGRNNGYPYLVWQYPSDGIATGVKTNSQELIPTELLLGNYPNPFNPTTTIQFSVEKDGKAVVKAFDILGREVATLYDNIAQAGKNYTATFNGSRFASGVYLYSIESNNQRIVKKMVMLK